VFYVVCHVRPRLLASHVSVPHVFQLRWNVGPRAFELQTAMYVVFHRSRFGDACHHALVVDQLAWAMLAYAVGGLPGVAVLVAIVIAQAISFGERALVAMLAVTWVVLGGLAIGVSIALGSTAILAAELALVGSALVRVLGHAAEPVPPLVGDETMNFTPIGFRPRYVITFLVAIVAEFCAGLPFRIFASQVYLVGQRLGVRARRVPSLTEMQAIATRLGRHGWGAWELTRPLFAWHPSCRDTAE
jgi:hypothetical protein